MERRAREQIRCADAIALRFPPYSTVTLFARFRGLSTSQPRRSGDVVRQELQRDRPSRSAAGSRRRPARGSRRRPGRPPRESPSLAMAITGPPRALISSMLLITLSIHGPLRHDEHARRVLVDQRDRPVLHLGGRVALGVDVADFLELQRPFERDRESCTAGRGTGSCCTRRTSPAIRRDRVVGIRAPGATSVGQRFAARR